MRGGETERGIKSRFRHRGRCEGVEEEKRRAAHASMEVKSCGFCLSCFGFVCYFVPQLCLLSVLAGHKEEPSSVLMRLRTHPHRCLTDCCQTHFLSFVVRTFSNGMLQHFGLDTCQKSFMTFTLVSRYFFPIFRPSRRTINTHCDLFVDIGNLLLLCAICTNANLTIHSPS